jgi:hypothetical protein
LTCTGFQLYINELKVNKGILIPKYLVNDIERIIKKTNFEGSTEDWIFDAIKKRIIKEL